jgi:phosphoribosylglycinamide formyltransferase-1
MRFGGAEEMTALRLGVLASGRGSDLQSLLDAREKGLIQSQVVVVVSDVADAKALGRARDNKIPAVAIEPARDLPVPERRRQHEDAILAALAKHKVDLVVLAGYMRILTPHLIHRYPMKIVNIHPALLPSFPGTHGQQQALDWGVRVAGCTTHLVDDQVDHGPILLQAAVAVRPDDTVETLSKRILAVEHQILPRTIHLLEEGRIKMDGRKVVIDAGPSFTKRLPVLPDTFYGPGY